MKKMLLLLVLTIPFTSCSNDDNGTPNELLGTWVWLRTSGGIAGTTSTPASTGNTKKIEISENSIKEYVNGSLVLETSYTLETHETALFSELQEMIVSEVRIREIVQLQGANLVLIDDCFDCFTREYQKE